MDSVFLKEYSLWLMPEGKEAKIIRRFFNDIHKHIKTVSFEPHVTLLGGLTLGEPQIIERINKLAAEISPFKISFTGVEGTENFYKSIFLKCKETQELMEANKFVKQFFSINQYYSPHMSIIYGDIDFTAKKEILDSISHLTVQSLAFNAGSIFLCKAFGTYDEWEIIYETPLKND